MFSATESDFSCRVYDLMGNREKNTDKNIMVTSTVWGEVDNNTVHRSRPPNLGLQGSYP